MPTLKSSKKRLRNNFKAQARNKAITSRMRTAIKNVLKAVDEGDAEKAAARYKDAVPLIDTMVNKGLVHANKAARHKSRLNRKVRELSGA